MTEFMEVWMFAASQVGLVAIGFLFGVGLTRRGCEVVVVDGDDLAELVDGGEDVTDA